MNQKYLIATKILFLTWWLIIELTLSIRWETPNRPRLSGSLVFKFPLYSSLSGVYETNNLLKFLISGPYTYTSTFLQSYTSCKDAFSKGIVVPDPGNPVTLFLTDNSTVSCSIENIYNGTVSCPIGWQGKADDGLCFKVRTEKVTNEEACRKVVIKFFLYQIVLSFLNRPKVINSGIWSKIR